MATVSVDIAPGDAQAIEELLYQSVWLTDHGQADRLPETLARDGRVYGLGSESMDHAQFADWARRRAANATRKTRHLVSNIRLRALPDGRVRGDSILVIYALDGTDGPELSFVGDQVDVFVHAETGEWLIAERRLVPLGQ